MKIYQGENPLGSNGKSAYQAAVDGGYTGSEADFQTLLAGIPNAEKQKAWNEMEANIPSTDKQAEWDAKADESVVDEKIAAVEEKIPSSDKQAEWNSCITLSKEPQYYYNGSIPTYIGDSYVLKDASGAETTDSGDSIDDALKDALQWGTKGNMPLSYKITLAASDWDASEKTQTISNLQMEVICTNYRRWFEIKADESLQLITVMPTNSSIAAYYDAGILCTGQAARSLTFTCDTIPTEDIQVWVVVQDVKAVSQ